MTNTDDVPDDLLAQPRIFGRWGFWLAMVAVVTLFAGLSFGYDQGVIGGALPFMQEEFGFGEFVVGVVTSWVTLGALFGALGGGAIADRVGRRSTPMTAAVLFIAGGVIQAVSPGVAILIVGRFVMGFGVGIASVAAPLYAAEMAPAASRGRFVSTYQLSITIGILFAQLVDLVLTDSGSWRVMVGLAAVPGVLLLVAALVVPESPRWLMKMGRREEAREARVKVQGAYRVDDALDATARDLADSTEATWGDVLAKSSRRALWVGAGLALFLQITGINAIIYYSGQILADAGFTSATAEAEASLIAVGMVNVLATFIAIAFVDRLGRRPLLFAGLIGMFAGLLMMAVAFTLDAGTGVVAIVGRWCTSHRSRFRSVRSYGQSSPRSIRTTSAARRWPSPLR